MERNSAHELLRIFAMFFIVLYHLISYCLYLIPHDQTLDYVYEAFLPTVHIGVILFVLISGYYQIKPSVHGLFKLVFIVLVYYLPVELARCVHHGGNVVDTLMFLSYTPYWFVRTYLFLYIVSPLLNKFINSSKQKSVNLLMAAFAVIAVYFGSTHGDASLADGKNLVNFVFLYFLGYSLHYYQKHWESINQIKLLLGYALLNIVVVLLLLFKNSASGEGLVWRLSFPYCGPILIVNAVCIFMVFSKLTFNSRIVNFSASSMFAVYLIHCQPTFHKYVIMPVCEIAMQCYPPFRLIAALILVSVCVMVFCVLVDKMLVPLWNLSGEMGCGVENWIKGLVKKNKSFSS